MITLVEKHKESLEKISQGSSDSKVLIAKIREDIGKQSAFFMKIHGAGRYNVMKEVDELSNALRSAIQNSYVLELE